MAKTEHNLRASEELIRSILQGRFRQNVKADDLRAAAEKLCEVVPEPRRATV